MADYFTVVLGDLDGKEAVVRYEGKTIIAVEDLAGRSLMQEILSKPTGKSTLRDLQDILEYDVLDKEPQP